MISKKIIEFMKDSKKSFFSFYELLSLTGAKKEVLKVALSRLKNQGTILHLAKGYYSLPGKSLDLEALAVEIAYNSYISLEYSLSIYGILSQVPASITLVTDAKNRNLEISNRGIEFAHIKKSLFFGYEVKGNTKFATPEKALLDELYFVGLKKRSLSLDELDISSINKKIIKEWIELYPPSTKALAKKMNLI